MSASRLAPWSGRIRIRRSRRVVPASAIVPEYPEDAVVLDLVVASARISLAAG